MKKNIIIPIFILLASCAHTEDSGFKIYKRTFLAKDFFSKKKFSKKTLKMQAIEKYYLLGKFTPKNDTNFVEATLTHANRRNLFLRKETYQAFKKMYIAAKADGINLTIVSATRNFFYQKRIWERKWNGERIVEGKNLSKEIPNPAERALIILKYSSMPGTSRHHWGTDIDLNSVNSSYFETNNGKKIYNWLVKNAHRFGFCQTYSPKGKNRPTGYEEEKWHWSYMPLAQIFLENYKNKVTYSDINGFKGSATAKELNVIKNYVLAINKGCFEY